MRIQLLGVLFLETEQDLDRDVTLVVARATHLGVNGDLSRVLEH